jgi:glycosyltransferase involved in cell wall biosynthesis
MWKPDAVHITGWAWASHLSALRAFHNKRIRTLFRGDSHLLDPAARSGPRWLLKRAVLSQVYRWPSAFLVTGNANRAYYEAFGVPHHKLFPCPHSIDVKRFAEPQDAYESKASDWRQELNICSGKCALLFAGKFEAKKNPVGLMKAVLSMSNPNIVLIMLGSGELQQQVNETAARNPTMFRILPFQNQSRMPIVYRLGDLFVLPSVYNETWGLATNEALACGRPVLISNRVGCAEDVVTSTSGRVFDAGDPAALTLALVAMCRNSGELLEMRRAAAERAKLFDIKQTADATVSCLREIGFQ